MKPQELDCSVCMSRTTESVRLVLTGRDKVRINEPFAFGQNDTLSKPRVCSTRALRPRLRVRHFCACSLGFGEWGGGEGLSGTSAHVTLKDTGRHRPDSPARVR